MRNDDIGPGCVTPSALALIPSVCVAGFVAVFTYGVVSDWWRWTAGSFFLVFGCIYVLLMAQYRTAWIEQNWPKQARPSGDKQTDTDRWQERSEGERHQADIRQDAIDLVDWSIEKYTPQGKDNILLSAADANGCGMSGRRWDEVTNAMRDKSLIIKVSRQPTVVANWLDGLSDLRQWLVDNPLSPTG